MWLNTHIVTVESWINSTDCIPEPTWRNFFKILKDTSPELGQHTYQIKEIFHGRLQCIWYLTVFDWHSYLTVATDAADNAAKLKADLVYLQSSSKSAEEMARELESSVALHENILQKIQKTDEEREQLAIKCNYKSKQRRRQNSMNSLIKF